jgi:hypothetical protein
MAYFSSEVLSIFTSAFLIQFGHHLFTELFLPKVIWP